MTDPMARSAADAEIETSDDAQIDELVDGIEVTRDEMTLTVEEIGDRLDPKNIVADAKETVRAATVGKVEEMAQTAGSMVSDAGETVRGAGSGIVDTITRNPLPAAMVGIGLGWLAMSRGSSSQQRYEPHRYQPNRYEPGRYQPDAYESYGNSETDSGMVQQARERASAVVDDVGRTVGDVRGQASQLAEEVPYRVQSTARQLGDQAGQVFQQNPLAVGAVAVAFGTAIGMILPATQVERRIVEQPARQVLSRAEEAATEALEQVEQTARDAEEQAREEDRQARPH